MADRYFVDRPITGDQARLSGAEAHHLTHVMRAVAGDEVVLFDGSGAEFTARIERVGRSEIELAMVSRSVIDREARVAVTLGVALPKGDRQRWLVEKAAELGVARLVPLVTERSNQRESAAGLEKLRRAVIEASKQCGRNRLLEIAAPEPLEDFLGAAARADCRLVAHPNGHPLSRVLDELAVADPQSVALAIGPEGGFSAAEIERAVAQGWQRVDLGQRILRVETAALALVAAVLGRVAGG